MCSSGGGIQCRLPMHNAVLDVFMIGMSFEACLGVIWRSICLMNYVCTVCLLGYLSPMWLRIQLNREWLLNGILLASVIVMT